MDINQQRRTIHIDTESLIVAYLYKRSIVYVVYNMSKYFYINHLLKIIGLKSPSLNIV